MAWSDTQGHEGVNSPWNNAQCRRILWHSKDRNFSAAVWEESLSLQRAAVTLRLSFSLQRDVAHQQPGEEKGRGKSCRINASRVLLSWIASSSHP